MSISLDQIFFYEHPTSGVHQRASQGRGQRSVSTCASITEKVAIHSAIGSCTHHGAASSSNDTAGLASEVHMQMVGNDSVQRDSDSVRTNSDVGCEKTPSISVEEPTAPGSTTESMADGASVAPLSVKAQNATTSRPFTLPEASTNSLLEPRHDGERELKMTASQLANDRAVSTPETTVETHREEATPPPEREQEIIASSAILTGSCLPWLEGPQSRSAGHEQIQEGFEMVTTLPGTSDTTLQSTEDVMMSPASLSSVITSPRETGCGVVSPGLCRSVLLRSVSGETTVPGFERQSGDSEDEAGPENTADPFPTGVVSSPAPRQVFNFNNSARVSSTAPPSPAPSASAPPAPAVRRSRRGKVPAGGYAEIDSDAESNADRESVMSSDDDRPFDKRKNPRGSLDRLGRKRRKLCIHEESAGEYDAAKRSRGSRQTPTQASPTRSSRRIAEHTTEIDVRSSPRSESASDEEQGEDHFATFDEFTVPFAPSRNLIVKYAVVDNVVTLYLNTHCRCQAPPEVDRRASISLPEPALARVPTGKKRKYSPKEDGLLRDLKQSGNMGWKEIHEQFSKKYPGRNIGALQVRYSTKLKH